MGSLAAPLPVEAVLPPRLLQHFIVVFDYGAKTMTIAAPGTIAAQGMPIPIRVNPRTGFATVEAKIDGALFPFVIDNGGSYSAIRAEDARLDMHPEWLRSVGGIGGANYSMTPPLPEADARVWKIPHIALGGLQLSELGVTEIGGPGWLNGIIGAIFWNRIYSEKAGERVEGWIGGNVLKSFRLTLDYHNGTSYWLQEAPLDTQDLDQVGIGLVRAGTTAEVGALARKNGAVTIAGVQPGDEVLKIDGLEAARASRGQLLDALHGKPGEMRNLELSRAGKTFSVSVPITAF